MGDHNSAAKIRNFGLSNKRGSLFAEMEHLNRAIEISPDCAEPYNQRATAHYLMEDFSAALRDCQRAVERMPCHFGAWAGLGHSYTHLGDFARAIEAYDQALKINPHMSAIRQALGELRSRANRRA